MFKFFGTYTWADPEVGQGVRTSPPPLKNHKNIGFHSNTGPDPLKKKTYGYQASIKCWAIIDTPGGGPMLARILWYLDPLSSQQKKKLKVDSLWQNFLEPCMHICSADSLTPKPWEARIYPPADFLSFSYKTRV